MFAETGSNTELVYTNSGGGQAPFQWNGTRFVSGSLEWEPPAGFTIQGYHNQLMQLEAVAVSDTGATIDVDLGGATHSATLVASTNSIEFPFLGETWSGEYPAWGKFQYHTTRTDSSGFQQPWLRFNTFGSTIRSDRGLGLVFLKEVGTTPV